MTNAERNSYIKSLQKDLNNINKRIAEAQNKSDTAESDEDFAYWDFREDELIRQRSEIQYKMRKGELKYGA